MKKSATSLFEKIEIAKPSEIVVQKIQELISSGKLKPGDYLPPERDLSNILGVGRGHVQDALKQLRFFGILETKPQDGTVVVDVGINAMENYFSKVLKLGRKDFEALLETRVVLEVQSAKLTAERATAKEVKELIKLHDIFKEKSLAGDNRLEEDIAFHNKIADLCRNFILSSLIRLIMPDVIRLSKDLNICGDNQFVIALDEHKAVIDAIANKEPVAAGKAMEHHIQRITDRV
jgi:GntR family transcriptional regulator, transcriptional repressor for pyruvate dehydrogenase complex